LLAACEERNVEEHGSLPTLSEAQLTFGPLITTSNQPSGYQNGTGERLGFFRGSDGSIWGIPLLMEKGEARVCASDSLQNRPATDTYPSGWEIISSTNQPTGWRGGNGSVELVLRDASGTIHWRTVHGAEFSDSTMCGARIAYYRIVAAPE
jgi:hypothetical protein